MREGRRNSSIYRHEVRRAAIEALLDAVDELTGATDRGQHGAAASSGRARPLMTQDVRAIDWQADSSESVLRKIRAAEGHPGVLDAIGGHAFHLFGGHLERALRGTPGELIVQRDGAICRPGRTGQCGSRSSRGKKRQPSGISSCPRLSPCSGGGRRAQVAREHGRTRRTAAEPTTPIAKSPTKSAATWAI